MSKEIIRVSQANNLYRLCRLIRHSRGQQIFLVLPAEGKFAESIKAIQILRQLGSRLGKKIIFVSPKAKFRHLLKREGVAYLARLPQAEPDLAEAITPPVTVPSSQTRSSPIALRRVRFKLPSWKRSGIIALAIVVGSLLLVAIFQLALAKAQVIVTLQTHPFSQDFTIVLADESSPSSKGLNLVRGTMVEISATESKTFSATGSKNIGSRAEGTVLFRNRSGDRVSLKDGTRLISGQLTFHLKTAVFVPPATVNRLGEITPGEIKAQVMAAEGGAQGNLTAGRFSIPGLGALGQLLTAEVFSPFSGGTDQKMGVVSEEDIKGAQAEMEADSREKLETALTKKVPRGKEVHPSLVRSSVVEAVPSKKAGEEAEKFDLKVTLRLWTIALASQALPELIDELSRASLKPKERLTPDSLQNVQLEVSEEDYLQREITAQLRVEGYFTFRLDHLQMADSLRRKSFTWVKETVGRYPDVLEVAVQNKGLFTDRMPWLSRNIIIREVYQR